MKIALAQINPIIGDIEGNKKKILEYIDKARDKGAEIVIFPEIATIGYPPMDLLMNRKLVDDNIKSLNEIAGLCKDIAVVCGYTEYASSNPAMLYNAAAFINDGKIISRHYKTLLPSYDVFDEMRYFISSGNQEVVKYKDKTIGITICEDIWNDRDYDTDKSLLIGRKYAIDPVDNLIEMGIDLMINISASPYIKDKNQIKWDAISKIAKKNETPIIYINQVGGNDSLIFDGHSFYVNQNGDFISMAKGFEEDFLVVEEESDTKIIIPVESGIEDVRNALILGIRDYVRKCGFKGVALGLSGGIDSALTATLAVQALGPDSVMGITMPSMYSSAGSVDDSKKLAANLGIRIEEMAIKDLFSNYKDLLNSMFMGLKEDVTEENIQARIRGNLLMSVSNKFGSLLLTTGNKSELAMGYCTLYGDMAGGLAVISDLPKTMVYELSRHINRNGIIIPMETIEKPPSAELRPNQKDEDSLPPYEILDNILEMYIERHMSVIEIVSEGYDENIVRDILKSVDRSEYKRRQAPIGLKVTSKAFGSGRRIPIAQRFSP